MTDKEMHERYLVPMDIIREYDEMTRNTRRSGPAQYDDADLRRISRIMCLRELGFSFEEVRTYVRLCSDSCAPCASELCAMLEKKRKETLDDIHDKEETIRKLDYLMLKTARTQ